MPDMNITRRLATAAAIAMLSLTSAIAITTGTAGASGSELHQQAAQQLQAAPRTTKTKPVSTSSRPTTAPASSAATTLTSSTPTSPGLCATSQAVWFGGNQYCPGYVIGLTTSAYPAGSRVVLRGVQVVQVSGTNVTVMGGPSCLPNPNKPYCGASIPSVVVPFASTSSAPTYGQIINLYGVAGSRSMSPTGYEVIGFCDPDWGC